LNAHNLDKLTQEEKDMVALLFTMETGWTKTYMVEVKLDKPIKNMAYGGDGLHTHGGNGSRCYAHYTEDPDWAVIHVEDKDWVANPGDASKALDKVRSMPATEKVING